MYQKVRACVRIDGGLSEHFMVNTGVKQGCTLSPTLFNIFSRDLPDIFDGCDPVLLGERCLNCLMYADDTVILPQTRSGNLRNALRISCMNTALNGYFPLTKMKRR